MVHGFHCSTLHPTAVAVLFRVAVVVLSLTIIQLQSFRNPERVYVTPKSQQVPPTVSLADCSLGV